MLLEQLQERVMLSATIVTTTNATGVAQPSAWMGQLADSIPLTDISIPGTVNSAAGPSLQDALLGSGAENMVNPPSPTNNGVTDAQLAAYLTATTDSEAAIVADAAGAGDSQALNAAAIAANTAALTADTAAGITQVSTGAGLAIGLASDVTGLASAIATAAQTQLYLTRP
jgi:hypothetical protein